jgi:hypothetical protein
MVRAAMILIMVLFTPSAHAAGLDVIRAFIEQIKDIPGAVDELIRVTINTPIEVVSCQVRSDSLKDVEAPLLEIIASKTSLKIRLDAYVVSPSPDRWSRISETVPVLLDDLHRLGKISSDKARQFTSVGALSDAFIDLRTSIESRKIDVLEELQRLPEPKTAEERDNIAMAAMILGDEIERLRGAKDAIVEELSKGC